MNLSTLKSNLEIITGTEIKQVLFDFSEILNETLDKSYPLIFWDIDNSTWVENIRKNEQYITMNVFIISSEGIYTGDKFEVWDTIEGQLKGYLAVLGTQQHLQITSDEITKEYYPPALLTVDGELGIRYEMKFKLLC